MNDTCVGVNSSSYYNGEGSQIRLFQHKEIKEGADHKRLKEKHGKSLGHLLPVKRRD